MIDDKDNSAILRDIYIPLKTKKDVTIPQTITWNEHQYVVRGIMEHCIQKVIHRISSVVLPNTLYETEETRKAYNWFVIYNVPIRVNHKELSIGPTPFRF